MLEKQIYSPEDIYYKVSFISAGNMPLAGTSCILLISVGKKYHEAERLEGTIKLINQAGFNSCMVAVNDTLQRHNYSKMTEQDAYNYSLRMGDEWLERNGKYINQLKPQTKVVRWQDSLSHADYKKYKQMLIAEYSKNINYKNAIDETAMAFIDRLVKRQEADEYNKLLRSGVEYLLEECPIIMPIWAAENYDYIIYPKKMTAAMSTTRKIFVEPHLPDKAQWLALKIQLKFNKHYSNVSTHHQSIKLHTEMMTD